MSGLSASEIDHLAELARLSLSPAEKERFCQELPKIADFVEAIAKADIGNLQAKTSVPQAELREDTPKLGLSVEQIKALSPEFSNGHNLVPPVFGESSHD